MNAEGTGEGSGERRFDDPEFVPDVSASRMVAFSDGVFAVAITLLVLSVSIPANLDSADFKQAMSDVIPSLTAYALSFAVISSFWLAHHRCFMIVRRIDERLLVLNLLFLGVVTLIPFPTELIGDYRDQPLAVMLYSGTIATAGLLSVGLWWYSNRHRGLVDPATPPELFRHSMLRGLVVVAMFSLAVPLATIDTNLPFYCWVSVIPLRLLLGVRLSSLHSIYDDRSHGARPG